MAAARPPAGDGAAREVESPPVIRREGDLTVVCLHGEQDTSTAAGLADALALADATGCGDVVVDLSDVVFMDGAIIRELALGHSALRLQSRALMLRGPTKFAQGLLDLCGLVGLVEPVPVPVPVVGRGVPAGSGVAALRVSGAER